jgi:hypothetical protein
MAIVPFLEMVLSVTISKNGSRHLCLQKLIFCRCCGFDLSLEYPLLLQTVGKEIGFVEAYLPFITVSKNGGIYRGGWDSQTYLETSSL